MSQDVYIFGPQYSTFARTAALCCEEKQISYLIGLEPFGDEIKKSSPQHLELHPFGKGPVLVHNQITLFETAAIARYLDDVFPGVSLQPSSVYQRSIVDQWCSAISSYVYDTLVKHFLLELTMPKGNNGEIRWTHIDKIKPELQRIFAILHNQLSEQEYFCSEHYSIADALLTPILDYLQKLPHCDDLFQQWPNLLSYINRMQERNNAKNVLIPPDLN